MADLIQFRRDTAKRWEQYNPILAEGEIGFVLDTQNYKLGDGVHAWNDLLLRGFNGNIVDALGNDASAVISQKGLSDILCGLINRNDRVIDYQDLSVLDDLISRNPAEGGIYPIVRGKDTENPITIYILMVHWDNMLHQCNQWLFGNLVITDGRISGAHQDGGAYILHRFYSVKDGGADSVWSDWKYVQQHFLWDGQITNPVYYLGLNNIGYTAQKINELMDDVKNVISKTDEDNRNDHNKDISDLKLSVSEIQSLLNQTVERINNWENEINDIIEKQENLQAQIDELKQG